MMVMAEAEAREYRQELSVHPRTLVVIRRIVGMRVRTWGFGQLEEAVTLCVHELLTNVDKHAPTPRCVLTLQRETAGVRAIVSDPSTELPVLREPDWSAENGRGMVVLENLADAWGATLNSDGKDVWFEVSDHAIPQGA